MTTATFVKRYDDPARCRRAARHVAWLQALGTDVRVPRLLAAHVDQLVFEHVEGRHVGPDDLPDVAGVLGRLHAAAYQSQLHRATLDRPFGRGPNVPVAAFHCGRRPLLDQLGVDVTGLPAAFYKDANIRNFLLANDSVAVVDFDDLTLAPFGYDLAKLVVSAAMTYGRVARRRLTQALHAYNAATAHLEHVECTPARLDAYAELHWHLTARYVGTNGYRFAWPDVCTTLEGRP